MLETEKEKTEREGVGSSGHQDRVVLPAQIEESGFKKEYVTYAVSFDVPRWRQW